MDALKKRYFEDKIYYEKQWRYVEKEMNAINKLNRISEKALLKMVETFKSRDFLNIIDDGEISYTIIKAKNEILKFKYYELKLECEENQKKKDFQEEELTKFQIPENANKLERKSYMQNFINCLINPNSYKINQIIRDTVLHRIAFNDMQLSLRFYLSEFSNTDELRRSYGGLKYLIDINIQLFNKYKEKIEVETTVMKQEFKTNGYSIDKIKSELDTLLEMFAFVKKTAQQHFYKFENANNNNSKMNLYEVEIFFRDVIKDDYLNTFIKTKNLSDCIKLNDPVSESESSADSIRSNETNQEQSVRIYEFLNSMI
jgi:hypothetical protein